MAAVAPSMPKSRVPAKSTANNSFPESYFIALSRPFEGNEEGSAERNRNSISRRWDLAATPEKYYRYTLFTAKNDQ